MTSVTDFARTTRATDRDGSGETSAGVPVPRPPSYGRGFWLAAGAFLTAMAFSTLPTPLYGLYQVRDHFSSFVVTVVFAVYALGVIASLVLAGHVSDWVGRRRVLVPALAVEVLAAVVFVAWPALPGLILARFVSGVGIGAITATATAYLRDLNARSRPDDGTGRFEVVSSAANLGGLGVGTLLSGALAGLVGSALVVPYGVFAGLLVVAIVGLRFVPETVVAPAVRPRYRPQRVSLSHGDRSTTVMAGAGAFVGFAVFGLFTSLAPAFVGATLGHPGLLLAGVVPFVAFGAAALFQMASGGLDPRTRVLGGVVAMAVGLVAVAVAMEDPDLALFLVGGGLAGGGAGVLFKAALAAFVGSAEPSQRGEAASSLFFVAYLGLIVPVVGVGVATLVVSAQTAMLLLAAALLVILAVVAGLAVRGAGEVSHRSR
jgi:MFS family permease